MSKSGMPVQRLGRGQSKGVPVTRVVEHGVERSAKKSVGTPGYRGLFGVLDRELITLDAIAEALGISKLQMAETIGLSRETAYRPKRMETAKTQARAREVVEIVARIADWAGGEQQALSWYRAYSIPAFGGRTAEAVVKEGNAAAVREYLDHVALGGFA